MPGNTLLSHSTTRAALTSLLIFCFVIILYLPGLSGPFMLDDFGSLPILYDTINQRGFWYAVFDGGTGPTGRPISFFSFALQHAQWENPYYFKLVNVVIHAINAVLIFWLSHLVISRLPIKTNSNLSLICLSITLIWALHPIQVSSVLYVIQRMVLLSSTFMLMGCITYIYGRIFIEKSRLREGYTLTTLSIALFGLLALLSKETGFQIILYILCIEATLFTTNNLQKPKVFIYWRHLFITLPIILFMAYLLKSLDGFFTSYNTLRNFSMDERVLTQTKILWEYAAQILFPRISELGLYHDHYPALKSWLSPTSIATVAATSGLFITAFILRNKYPIYAFAALWFLFGHSMEASFIPLELYFEHRNYLPSFGIILGMVALLYWLSAHVQSTTLKYVYKTLLILPPVLLAGLTYQQTELWGNRLEYALVQSKEHPDSVRARSLMIAELSKTNQLDAGYKETQKMKQQFKLPSVWLTEVQYACIGPRFPLPELSEFLELMNGSKLDLASVLKWYELVELALDGDCDALTPDYLFAVLEEFEKNPRYAKHEQGLITSRAMIHGALDKDLPSAIQTLLPDSRLNHENRMLLARYLATLGLYEEALIVLDNADKSLSGSFKHKVKRKESSELRTIIAQDLVNQQQNVEQIL